MRVITYMDTGSLICEQTPSPAYNTLCCFPDNSKKHKKQKCNHSIFFSVLDLMSRFRSLLLLLKGRDATKKHLSLTSRQIFLISRWGQTFSDESYSISVATHKSFKPRPQRSWAGRELVIMTVVAPTTIRTSWQPHCEDHHHSGCWLHERRTIRLQTSVRQLSSVLQRCRT